MSEAAIEATIYELFGTIDQMAPGSPTSTRRALAMVPELATRRRVLDLGCGTGASTLVLAEELDAEIIALELHAPYIGQLRRRAQARGLDDKIDARVGDMRAPGIEAGSVDLVWAEGSLYAVGFDEGLELCRGLLAPGGALGLTQVAWLSDAPSDEARAFWAEEYPEIRTRAQVRDQLSSHGFELVGEFVLPRSDWDAYYGLVRNRAERFASQRSDPAAQAVLDSVRRELDAFERFGDEYGYVFHVVTAPSAVQ